MTQRTHHRTLPAQPINMIPLQPHQITQPGDRILVDGQLFTLNLVGALVSEYDADVTIYRPVARNPVPTAEELAATLRSFANAHPYHRASAQALIAELRDSQQDQAA